MKKILQLSVLMTMLMMASSSLFSACDMNMEPMDAPCKSLASLAGDRAVAYLEDALQESLLKLHELYPNWGSELFKQLCKDLKSKANVLLHEQAVQVVDECAAFCDQELKKNIADKQALEVIKADLQDYQQFLASAESRLNPHDEMMTKRRCCAPAVNCFNIAPYIPFLPTGPIPVSNTSFFAYRNTTAATQIPIAYTTIPFSGVSVTDGSWTWSAGTPTDFVATVSGTFLVSVTIPYTRRDIDEPSNSVYLQPTLNGNPIDFATVFYFDDLSTATPINTTITIYLQSTFMVSVAVGDVLRFQNKSFILEQFFFSTNISTPEPASNNGSVNIVRIR